MGHDPIGLRSDGERGRQRETASPFATIEDVIDDIRRPESS